MGKVGRVSQIIKEVRPFTGALYATYTAAANQDLIGPRQAPRRQAPCSRFSTAARWLQLLISGEDNDIFPLKQDVSHMPRVKATVKEVVFQVDASPWDGGTTLRHTWGDQWLLVEHMGYQRCLQNWCPDRTGTPPYILGSAGSSIEHDIMTQLLCVGPSVGCVGNVPTLQHTLDLTGWTLYWPSLETSFG